MQHRTIEYLRSPETGNHFAIEMIESEGDEIIAGRLIDEKSGHWFRIEAGIADLLPFHLRRQDRHEAFCNKYGYRANDRVHSVEKPLDAYSSQIDFFKDYHEQYESDVVESPFYQIFDAATFGHWLNNHLKPGLLVAEIGCGSGRQTLPMVKYGSNVIGFDLSEEMLIVARKKILMVGGRADFVVASADRLPVSPNVFEAIVIFGSLHHFPDAQKSISEAARILKINGKFYMVEPHDSLLRPLFELSMRIWTLWQEEAADEPLFNSRQWRLWLGNSRVEARISYSTVLPPHLFYLTGQAVGVALLRASDKLLNFLPGFKRLGGVIIADGYKK